MAGISEIIRRKRDGEALSRAHIEAFIEAVGTGSAGDEQLGAFAMAVFLNGMTDGECAALTEAMRDSGEVLRWDDAALPGPVLDKHSTGGVGDVTSLLVAPILAACGACVPMIAGRGLGHTGGTVDKLASIPGYDPQPGPSRLRSVVREVGCAIVGQTDTLAPADRRLYAVRDVTATVESVPLIVASILSKKLAEGLDALVLDVKTGNGAVMREPDRARHLAERLTEVGTQAGVRMTTLLTDMDQPLARSAGNALEVAEVIDCLTGRIRDGALRELSLTLAAEALLAGEMAADRDAAMARVRGALESGRAAEHFGRMVAALGGPGDLLEAPARHLPEAACTRPVAAPSAGCVQAIDVRALGMAVVELGGGRRRSDDRIDPAVGLTALKRIGEAVDGDEPLALVHAASDAAADQAARRVREAYTVGTEATQPAALVQHTINGAAPT